jgi:hypothetical protein
MNRLINLSRPLPTPDPDVTVAFTPIRLEMPGRQPLELRLTAPATGDTLPLRESAATIPTITSK